MKKGLTLLSAAVLLLSGCGNKKAAVDINEVLGYEGFSVQSLEFQYDAPEYCREIFEEIIGSASLKPVSVSGKTEATGEYAEFGSGGEFCRFSIREAEDGKKYLAHTLNNTVVAPPRMLIAFFENNLCADGSVNIPVALRPYMGGKEKLVPVK